MFCPARDVSCSPLLRDKVAHPLYFACSKWHTGRNNHLMLWFVPGIGRIIFVFHIFWGGSVVPPAQGKGGFTGAKAWCSDTGLGWDGGL